MNCEECNKPIEEIKNSMVEWISSEDWGLAAFIRLVHPGCCYYEKQKEILELMNASDHWLPLADMEAFLDIVEEMLWDDKVLAESSYIRYIKQRNNITGGNNHENNNS